MKTFKKLFSVSAIVALLGTLAPMYAFGATYSEEEQEAYAYAKAHGITTMETIEKANMEGNLTRVAMAKMIANYAIDVLGLEPDTSAKCTFSDVTAALDAQYNNGVTQACQLGLMGQGITAFRPNDLVTRGEFGTVLSRALNANDPDVLAEMNKANPFYKAHLTYLNEEGIMKNISDPDMTERRGWVMMMMMRADEEYTEASEGCSMNELLACFGSSDISACMAECNGNPEEPEEPLVVKKGTLNVSATANEGVKAIIGGVSELDTINLKASEDISVEKVTLEKYGYTKNAGITVWLENTDGVEISTKHQDLSSNKDDVTLTIKKDYRSTDTTSNYVIVTQITAGVDGQCSTGSYSTEATCITAVATPASCSGDTTKTGQTACENSGFVWNNAVMGTWTAGTTNHTAGETLGFKVKDVTSSAETLRIASYTPTEYLLAVNNSTNITFAMKGKATTYNYEAGESYQVAKMRITAGNADINVNGFTLTQNGDLDLEKNVKKVEVLGDDGKALTLSTTDIQSKSLKVSFPNQKIEAKKNADFTVLVTMNDDFDKYNSVISLNVGTKGTINATEIKTSIRVTATSTADTPYAYTFQGSKIKLTNTNLGTISAPQGKEDLVVAEGTIELSEAVTLNPFNVIANETGIESLELWLNGALVDEASVDTLGKTFTFSDVNLEKGGKLQFVADLADEIATGTIGFTTPRFDKSINGLQNSGGYVGEYDESGEGVMSGNMVGAISFYNIKLEATKGALENTLSKKVEIITDGTATRKVVFDGTYTAKKGDVYLNELTVTPGSGLKNDNESIVFYISIDGDVVADVTVEKADGTTAISETFTDILVAKGESVAVKVEAEAIAYEAHTALDYTLAVNGEDEDGNPAGGDSDSMVTIAFVNQGTVSVITQNANLSEDVVLQGTNITLADFTVKSTVEGTKLASFELTLPQIGGADPVPAKLEVRVDGEILDLDDEYSVTTTTLLATGLSVNADSEDGVAVKVSYKAEIPAKTGAYVTTIEEVNGTTVDKDVKKLVVPALVKVTSQTNLNDETKYKFSVETYDSTIQVSDFAMNGIEIGDITDGYEDTLPNGPSMVYITGITYEVGSDTYTIDKATYKNYFKVGDTYLKIFKAKDE